MNDFPDIPPTYLKEKRNNYKKNRNQTKSKKEKIKAVDRIQRLPTTTTPFF
uniref:Uncharacterized protein n=1 Tax=Rhizophagus irregularis (strain DAOM 181602 / DAOM 197198 / MUCL 43194) TaxID=747089 RepID=U9TUG5_RHIID